MTNRIYITAIFIFIFCGSPVWAQKDMHISPFFSGEYNTNPHAEVIILKGKKLKPYGLNLFHSIALIESPDDVRAFEKAVLKDGESAVEAKLIKKENEIIACYYQLSPHASDSDKMNRFILFRKEDNETATLIYMEGKTELDKLIQIFIDKKE